MFPVLNTPVFFAYVQALTEIQGLSDDTPDVSH